MTIAVETMEALFAGSGLNPGQVRAILEESESVGDMEIASYCRRALYLETDPECPDYIAEMDPARARRELVAWIEAGTITPLQVINGIAVWCMHAADQNAGTACEACIASQIGGG